MPAQPLTSQLCEVGGQLGWGGGVEEEESEEVGGMDEEKVKLIEILDAVDMLETVEMDDMVELGVVDELAGGVDVGVVEGRAPITQGG